MTKDQKLNTRELFHQSDCEMTCILHQIGEDRILKFVSKSLDQTLHSLETKIEYCRKIVEVNKIIPARRNYVRSLRERIKRIVKIKKDYQKMSKLIEQVIRMKQEPANKQIERA